MLFQIDEDSVKWRGINIEVNNSIDNKITSWNDKNKRGNHDAAI